MLKDTLIIILCISVLMFVLSGCSATNKGNGNADETDNKIYSDIRILNTEEPYIVSRAKMPNGAVPEVSPWLLTRDGKTRFFISTAYSFSAYVNEGKSFIKDVNVFDKNKTFAISHSDIYYNGSIMKPDQLNPETYWRRNYNGLFSAHLIKDPDTGEEYVVSINHGENKNEIIQGRRYNNTVQPPAEYTLEQYSGVNPKTNRYQDYPYSYFSFLTLACCPVSDNDGNNLSEHEVGPILWPASGYLDNNNNRLTSGMKHPSSIIHDGYLYVYYLDNDRVMVARAPVNKIREVGSFKKYYNGEFNEPALPEGFNTKDRRFFYEKAGSSSPLFDTRSIRFSVAKIKGTSYFLGVEERFYNWPEVGVYLRLSKDLVNWTEGVEVPGTRVEDWHDGSLHYAVFVNKEFTDNTEIDPSGFYLMGSVAGTTTVPPGVHVRYMEIELVE